MVTIGRHDFDHDFVAEKVGAFREIERVSLERALRKPIWTHDLHAVALSHAGYRSALDPTAAGPEIWNSVVLAGQAGAAVFAVGAPEGEQFEVILGTPLEVTGTGSRSYTDAETWLAAHHLALVRRDMRLLHYLCAVPMAVLRDADGKMGEYAYLWIDALQTYWRREEGVLSKLNDALAATDPSRLTVGKQIVLLRHYPVLKLFHYLVQHDGEGFNASLAEGLKSHKQFWKPKNRANDPDGLIALALLGLACVAHDLDLGLTVESDYLPKHLLDGSHVD
ncbi:immunity 49 family protein [Actinokineospora sp. NBRC 105648]|uniref:immunity 49 family protein n=1 Tax=Actinokineospora sp. NBRC 105648 TaxID=3032206 RepID=UPI00249F9BC9|nr:immunity 49 family protein [Actinokineospora sp. NBRC 105648]GLZ42552.1 hypothetical protein Acsp05_61760 [Actinokineospora sp. NBRC 105648]